jgi:hypothetical protein
MWRQKKTSEPEYWEKVPRGKMTNPSREYQRIGAGSPRGGKKSGSGSWSGDARRGAGGWLGYGIIIPYPGYGIIIPYPGYGIALAII